jgi:hypothetical protein
MVYYEVDPSGLAAWAIMPSFPSLLAYADFGLSAATPRTGRLTDGEDFRIFKHSRSAGIPPEGE